MYKLLQGYAFSNPPAIFVTKIRNVLASILIIANHLTMVNVALT